MAIEGFAKLAVNPWLAYSCLPGMRMEIRAIGAMKGSIGTMLRVADDGTDRCVIRTDSHDRGYKDQVVDPRPDTVIPTPSPQYDLGDSLLYLHKGVLVDATVLASRAGKSDGLRPHKLKLSSSIEIDVDLNYLNHCRMLLGAKEYEETRRLHCQQVVREKISSYCAFMDR